jgi:hypothetical protein
MMAETPRAQPAACKPHGVTPGPTMDGIREALTAGA